MSNLSDTTHVTGLRDLAEFLDKFPEKFQKNVMRGALRAGMKVVKPDAKDRIHSVSGLLAKGLKTYVSIHGNTVTVSLRATGKHAFVARWVEYGTRSHEIIGFQAFKGMVRRIIHHPGAKARPFMRPALDARKGDALVAVGRYIQWRLLDKGAFEAVLIDVEEE